MDRRRFLATLAAGGFAGLAGCAGRDRTPTPQSTFESRSLAEQGVPSTICEQDVVDVGIYAIDEPAFGDDWSTVEGGERYLPDGRLAADTVVVGVARAGAARAYPLPVLWAHEIVNDVFGGPLMVTYCSLCRSGMVAERLVGGEPATFAVSGQLWQPPELWTRASEEGGRVFAAERGNATPGKVRNTGNLVMIDLATGSFWSQLLAEAICGPRRGDRLEIVPSSVTTWGEWRRDHPGTDVLLPPPQSSLVRPPYPVGEG